MTLISDPLTLVTGILIALGLILLISCHLYAPKLLSADQATEEQQQAAAARRRRTALKAHKSGLDLALLESFPTMTVAQARKEDALRKLVRLQLEHEETDERVDEQPYSAGCMICLKAGKKLEASENSAQQESIICMPGLSLRPPTPAPPTSVVEDPCADGDAAHHDVSPGDAVYVRECVVCLGEYDDEEIVRRLPLCRHWFHTACIDQWLMSRSTCPLCRTSMKQAGAGGREADSGAEGSVPVVIDVAVTVQSSSHGYDSDATDPHTHMQHEDGQGLHNSTTDCSHAARQAVAVAQAVAIDC